MSLFLYLVILLLVALICFIYFCKQYESPKEFIYAKRPSLLVLYVKGLCVSFTKKQGVLVDFDSKDTDGTKPQEHSDCKVTAQECRIDKKTLTQYAQVCGYSTEDITTALPCFLETYFMPLLITLVTSKTFQLSPLGLIHIRQRVIAQCTKLAALLTSAFTLECSVASYSRTDRGIEVAILMRAYDSSQLCVWEGVATLLSRSRHKQKIGEHRRTGSTPTAPQADTGLMERQSMLVNVPADLGVRYARVSGDWNPHHLWPWSARFLGYKAPIVHGMWTVARALALLYSQDIISSTTNIDVEAAFKRPVFLPGSSSFSWCSLVNSSGTTSIEVHDKQTGVPQLIGRMTVLP